MSKDTSYSLPCIEAALPRRSMSLTTTTCLGTTTFYDDKSSYEYEVESSTLTYEEACHFSELLLSHEIENLEFNRL